jgi:hypothetical protein
MINKEALREVVEAMRFAARMCAAPRWSDSWLTFVAGAGARAALERAEEQKPLGDRIHISRRELLAGIVEVEEATGREVLSPEERAFIKSEGSRTTTGSPEWQPFADALLARLQLLQREVATGGEIFQAVLDCVNLIAKMTDHDAPQADIVEAVDAVATKSGVAHTTIWMMATQAFWMTAARMFAELPPVTGK